MQNSWGRGKAVLLLVRQAQNLSVSPRAQFLWPGVHILVQALMGLVWSFIIYIESTTHLGDKESPCTWPWLSQKTGEQPIWAAVLTSKLILYNRILRAVVFPAQSPGFDYEPPKLNVWSNILRWFQSNFQLERVKSKSWITFDLSWAFLKKLWVDEVSPLSCFF